MRKRIFVLAIFFTLAFIISSTGLGSVAVAVQKYSSPPIMRLTQEEVMETTLVSSNELNNSVLNHTEFICHTGWTEGESTVYINATVSTYAGAVNLVI